MVLPELEAKEFFDTWMGLIGFVNDEYDVIPGLGHPKTAMDIEPPDMNAVRERLWADTSIIDRYIDSQWDMPPETIQTLKGWRNCGFGDYFMFRHLKKYTVFLGQDERVYGVVGISNELSVMFPKIPILVQAVLLPFRGRIVYDSLISTYAIHIGGGFREVLNDEYRAAKAERRILTTADELLGKA